jgi:UDP-N-acetylmuramoyl-tripeptide--D-alanyl-D-alanine ligase
MFSLGEMARILGDKPANYLPGGLAAKAPSCVVTDSRQAGEGSLFVCIRGKRVDGHDFIRQAAEQGALAVIASCDVFGGETPPLAVIYADDSVAALGRLGAAQRDAFRGFVAGISGSAGKTSVKEALASVLAVRGTTSRNFMNLNSQIGLPVSLLNADPAATSWVMEAGISAPHDMDELGVILRPDLTVIINVGAAHLSGLEDKGVAHYKSRLLKYAAPGGRALVSADYPDLARESREAAAQSGADLKFFSTRKADAD